MMGLSSFGSGLDPRTKESSGQDAELREQQDELEETLDRTFSLLKDKGISLQEIWEEASSEVPEEPGASQPPSPSMAPAPPTSSSD
jgi:hypothetical protein